LEFNQIANFVLAQSEINTAIGDKAPQMYFQKLAERCDGGKKKYGRITNATQMKANLRANCLPETLLGGTVLDYDTCRAALKSVLTHSPCSIRANAQAKTNNGCQLEQFSPRLWPALSSLDTRE
jgi:hypothetical protein